MARRRRRRGQSRHAEHAAGIGEPPNQDDVQDLDENDSGIDQPRRPDDLAEILEVLQKPPRSRTDSLLRLLSAIATEELVLASIIGSEAEKTHAVKENMDTPFTPEEVIRFQHSLSKVIAELAKKEELLIKKLRLVMSMLGDEDMDEVDEDEKDQEKDDMFLEDEEENEQGSF